jgi:hypothetical protein
MVLGLSDVWVIHCGVDRFVRLRASLATVTAAAPRKCTDACESSRLVNDASDHAWQYCGKRKAV